MLDGTKKSRLENKLERKGNFTCFLQSKLEKNWRGERNLDRRKYWDSGECVMSSVQGATCKMQMQLQFHVQHPSIYVYYTNGKWRNGKKNDMKR